MNLISIHNVKGDWQDLNVNGLKYYWDRSLLLNRKIVVCHTDLEDSEEVQIEDYLKRIEGMGIGPDRVIDIRQRNGFYEDILASDKKDEILKLVLEEGYKLELFSSEDAAIEFVEEGLELDWSEHVTNPHPDVYKGCANKARLREKLESNGCDVCPVNYYTRNWTELLDVFGGIKDGSPVVVKRPDKASSEGMIFYTRESDNPDDFKNKHWDEETGAIVEPAYEHHPCSVSFCITDKGVNFLYCTLQDIGESDIGEIVDIDQLRKGDMKHMGNAVSSDLSEPLGPLDLRTKMKMKECGENAAKVLFECGYRGKIVFDLAFVPEGDEVYLLEANPRGSHSWYVYGLMKQLKSKLGEPLVVVGCNVEGIQVDKYEQAFKRLPNPNKTLLFHVPLIDLGVNKCGVCAFGNSFKEAKHEFEMARYALKRRG